MKKINCTYENNGIATTAKNINCAFKKSRECCLGKYFDIENSDKDDLQKCASTEFIKKVVYETCGNERFFSVLFVVESELEKTIARLERVKFYTNIKIY